MPGPAPKPTRLKALEGNPGHRRLNGNEPRPEPGIPSRPEWLSPEAKREWARLAPALLQLGLLTPIDRELFSALCATWGMYVQTMRDLAANGMTQVSATSGLESARPGVGVAVKLTEKMIALSARFGLSPSDRSRLSAPAPEAVDEFQEFLQRCQTERVEVAAGEETREHEVDS